MKKQKKIKIEILTFLVVFIIFVISPFFNFYRVFASTSITIPYVMTNYEYTENITSMGKSQDLDYMLSNLQGDFAFSDNDNLGKQSAQDFADFLVTDSTFLSMTIYNYKFLRFSYGVWGGRVFYKVECFSSERPIYLCGRSVYSYLSGDATDFNAYQFSILYWNDDGVFSLRDVEIRNSSPFGDGTTVQDGTLVKITYGSVTEHVVFSDGPVRFKYDDENLSSFEGAYYQCGNAQLFYDNEQNGWSNYPVCAIDRRELFPDYVSTQYTEDERYILENSKCGFDKYSYFIDGSATGMNDNLTFEMNEYTKLRRNKINVEITYGYSVTGQLYSFKDQINRIIKGYYDNSMGGNSGTVKNNYSTFSNEAFQGSDIITIPLSTYNQRDTISNNVYNYLHNYNSNTIYYKNTESLWITRDKYIGMLFDLCGYNKYTYYDTVFTNYMSIVRLGGSSYSKAVSQASIIMSVRLVDTENSDKSTGQQFFRYNLLTGSTSTDGDSIIYDDSDIVNDPDVPTIMTTESDTSVTTQTVVVDSDGKIVVQNSNVNNNNPEVHVAPSINVYTGSGSDSATTTDTIIISDDDGEHEEDVQDIINSIENFLDFDNIFFDEFITKILSVLPSEVWEPFAIASGFIALASMIAFVLRR